MENSNDILKALGQVPDLTEATRNALEALEQTKKMHAEVLQKGLQTAVPPEELQKVYSVAARGVRETTCRLPDPDTLSALIATKASEYFARLTSANMKDVIRQAFKDTPVEHVYTYARPRDLLNAMEPKARLWTVFATAVAAASLIVLIGIGASYYHTQEYIGRQYMEIYFSKYTTDAETEMLSKDLITLSALPKEYDKTPKIVRQRIKRNLEILGQRKAEAKANKGKFSTKVPLER